MFSAGPADSEIWPSELPARGVHHVRLVAVQLLQRVHKQLVCVHKLLPTAECSPLLHRSAECLAEVFVVEVRTVWTLECGTVKGA